MMDLIGLGADKQAIILDIGSSFTKIGFAGEHVPRHIIRTEIEKIQDSRLEVIPIFSNVERNYEDQLRLFKDFFHMIYFKYLLVNPKERRVIICESMLKPISIRDMIAKVLFKYFKIVSIIFLPSHISALFTLGLRSGLVLDCGYSETSVIPIYEQTPILSAVEYIDLAGKSIHERLNKDIMENAIVQVKETEKSAKSYLKELNDTLLEDIKVRCCFVGRRACDLVACPVKYPIGCDLILHVTGKLRAHAFDVLFEGNEEDKSIATIVLDSILKCPIDCRRELAQNIVLIGGSVMSPGFDSRMLSELKFLLKSDFYKDKLFLKEIAFRKSPVPANYCAWQGATIFGALEILADHSISRDRYEVDPTISDWSSVLSVNKEDASKSLLDDKYKWKGMRKTLSSSSSPSLSVSPSVSERIKKELGLSK